MLTDCASVRYVDETKQEIFELIARTTDISWQNRKLIGGGIFSILVVCGFTWWMNCKLNKLTKQNEIMLQKIRVLEAAELAAKTDLETKKLF